MGKRKLKLELIKNNSTRKNCLRVRKGGLIKKTEELSILCGVEACAIIHDGPNDLNPTVWPSPEEAQHVVNRFKNLPEMGKNKRMTNPEDYLKQRNKKLVKKIKQQQLENREMEMTEVMYQALNGKGLGGMKKEDLDDLYWIIQKKEKEIENRIDALRKKTSVQQLIMNPHAGQQLPPPPPNGYNGGDAFVMPTPPPPNGYYGGDASVMMPTPPPPPNGYYGGDLSVMPAPPPPNGYYGGDTSVMPTPPPSTGYYGGDTFVMPAPPPPPNGYMMEIFL
uniref:MADS-box protein AGL80 n=1 Tax=Aquilegia coerulea TaxID=218851 RepID=K7XWN7_AQUCA|nr:MADS-box protein AGL80 [Aquilegia coerulea]